MTGWSDLAKEQNGGGGQAARAASALERLNEALEGWMLQAPGQPGLIYRNIRTLAAQYPALSRAFNLPRA